MINLEPILSDLNGNVPFSTFLLPTKVDSTVAGFDMLRGVLSPLKPFYITTRRCSEKSIFW